MRNLIKKIDLHRAEDEESKAAAAKAERYAEFKQCTEKVEKMEAEYADLLEVNAGYEAQIQQIEEERQMMIEDVLIEYSTFIEGVSRNISQQEEKMTLALERQDDMVKLSRQEDARGNVMAAQNYATMAKYMQKEYDEADASLKEQMSELKAKANSRTAQIKEIERDLSFTERRNQVDQSAMEIRAKIKHIEPRLESARQDLRQVAAELKTANSEAAYRQEIYKLLKKAYAEQQALMLKYGVDQKYLDSCEFSGDPNEKLDIYYGGELSGEDGKHGHIYVEAGKIIYHRKPNTL